MFGVTQTCQSAGSGHLPTYRWNLHAIPALLLCSLIASGGGQLCVGVC